MKNHLNSAMFIVATDLPQTPGHPFYGKLNELLGTFPTGARRPSPAWRGSMQGTMTISGKAIGRRKPLFEDFSVPIPPDARSDGGEGGMTLRDLIARIVSHEVQAYHDR